MEALPLAVWLGEKVPQLGALEHIATQSTPASAGSLLTVADTEMLLPTIKEDGGACVNAIEMKGVWAWVIGGLVRQPAIVPREAKLQKVAKDGASQRFRMPSRLVLS